MEKDDWRITMNFFVLIALGVGEWGCSFLSLLFVYFSNIDDLFCRMHGYLVTSPKLFWTTLTTFSSLSSTDFFFQRLVYNQFIESCAMDYSYPGFGEGRVLDLFTISNSKLVILLLKPYMVSEKFFQTHCVCVEVEPWNVWMRILSEISSLTMVTHAKLTNNRYKSLPMKTMEKLFISS